jgi:phage terminase large subunit
VHLKLTNKLEPFRSKKKRIKIAFGGRGGTKSTSVAKILAMRVQTEGFKVGCFREHQNTLDDSVHALLKEVIMDMTIPGYNITDKHITHKEGGAFKFRGLARNLGGVKSFHGFKIFWVEEGEFLSEDSLKILLPTLREQDSELWITLNPKYEEDAVSQRYILPHYEELLVNGVYEDEDLYIVWTNWDENPWFPVELQRDRIRDYANLPRSEYDHVWLGFFDTKVENSLIQKEWFDACINAHKKLGFAPVGVKMASHDPSDTGPDDKGFAYRHGSVVLDIQEMKDGDINEGGDWATECALQYSVDAFNWDCDGMGVGLNRQITEHFRGKPTKISMFKGSEGPDFPSAIYENSTNSSTIDQKSNKESLKNKRAQYYLALRNRIYNTYQAVTKGQWKDVDKLISFDSEMKLIPKLRSELCRMPIKPNHNGLFELYTKKEMNKLFKFKSPNLADAVMMTMRVPQFEYLQQQGHRPKPVRAMGIGA